MLGIFLVKSIQLSIVSFFTLIRIICHLTIFFSFEVYLEMHCAGISCCTENGKSDITFSFTEERWGSFKLQ